MRAVLVGLLTLFSMVSSVCGTEVRTYRIAQTDVPSFRFGGGLLDFDLTAHLQGTLEVTITDEATASVSRFDLTLHNLANTGTYDLGWAEGDRLGEHLHFDPLSLAGEHTHDVVDRLVLSAVQPALSYAVLSSALSIYHTSDSLAVLRLTSTYLEANPASELPRPVLDVPNMRIETSPKVGLLVRLVPEPSGVMIAASFLAVGLVRRTRRIC